MEMLDWRARALQAALDEDLGAVWNILSDQGSALLQELADAAEILRKMCAEEIAKDKKR
jgi:hypothetical protein